MAEDLQKQFPDLTQSVCVGVLSAMEGDRAKAIELLQGISSSSPDKEAKLRELERTFEGQDVTTEELKDILEQSKYDVDSAIVVVMELIDRKNTAIKQRVQEQERARRQQEAQKRERERAQNQLKEIFATVPEEKILEILDESEGDPTVATTVLLQYLAQLEEDEKHKQQLQKERQEMDRLLLKEAICEKMLPLMITEAEVTAALTKYNYNAEAVIQSLTKLSEEKKQRALESLFRSFSPEEITQALQDAAWELVHAQKTLTTLRYKRQKEEEEQRAIQEALKRADFEKDEERKAAELKAEEERKRAEEERKKAEEERKKAQEEKKKTDWKEQSVILNKEVQECLQQMQEEQKKQQTEYIKTVLEQKLRINPSDVPGFGNIPITPKIIDELNEKREKRLAEAEETKVSEPKEQPPAASVDVASLLPPSSSAPSAPVNHNVVTATPSIIDVGEKITVEWNLEDYGSANDWLGIIPVSAAANVKPATWIWNPSTEKTGTATFTAPSEFGTYEIRFYSNKSYNTKAVSNPIHVGPQITMTATEAPENTKEFPRKVNVVFTKNFGIERTNSWIAMYPKSQPDNYYWLNYQWVTYGVSQKATFEVPKAGEWEFRFFPTNSKPWVDVARCSILIAGDDKLELTHIPANNQITVNCTVETVDPATEKPWVGIYHTTEENLRQYRRYKHISSQKATLTFKALQHSGTYEARLYVGDRIICRSNPITITIP